MTEDQIEKAGQIIKVLYLANSPGMDAIAVKLNCGLTYGEMKTAKRWAKAFELAEKSDDIFQLAIQMSKIGL
jgi:hypothetical protein